jgi:hypothetical protein
MYMSVSLARGGPLMVVLPFINNLLTGLLMTLHVRSLRTF